MGIDIGDLTRGKKGWTREKAEIFSQGFEEFSHHIWINSKELGRVRLGDNLYRAQKRFNQTVFDGLSQDKHDFKHLKSRQLGISTDSRALTVFWAGVFEGLKGYMVFDINQHKEEARLELLDMFRSLPASYKFPRIVRENRDLCVLENDTMINFAVAGVTERKGGVSLGVGSGINFAHLSEVGRYANAENITVFKNSLAQNFENRLYIWESTGRGYGLWYELCEEAKIDLAHQVFIFTGWWAKDDQQIAQSDPDFERYGRYAPTPEESRRIVEVRERYGWQITQEQLAWVRRYLDPLAKQEGDQAPEFTGDVIKIREQSWTEDDAFASGEAIFFHPEMVKVQREKYISNDYKTYCFQAGIEFTDMRAFPAPNPRSVELKVWEEPGQDDVICIAADVAFGQNENNDRSSIQVMKCYSDGLDQVAEFASPLYTAQQFAWVILALAAWYAEGNSEVFLIVELNGPGYAVWDEIQTVKKNMQNGYYQSRRIDPEGLTNIIRNVRNFIYTRPDTFGSGRAMQWKTNPGAGPAGKVRIMERLRDFLSNEMIHIRSESTLSEMQSVTRVGDSIAASGTNKDDRVMALSFAVRCWEDRARRTLASSKKTRDNEMRRKRMSLVDKVSLFKQNQLDAFLGQQRKKRKDELTLLRRRAWRGR